MPDFPFDSNPLPFARGLVCQSKFDVDCNAAGLQETTIPFIIYNKDYPRIAPAKGAPPPVMPDTRLDFLGKQSHRFRRSGKCPGKGVLEVLYRGAIFDLTVGKLSAEDAEASWVYRGNIGGPSDIFNPSSIPTASFVETGDGAELLLSNEVTIPHLEGGITRTSFSVPLYTTTVDEDGFTSWYQYGVATGDYNAIDLTYSYVAKNRPNRALFFPFGPYTVDESRPAPEIVNVKAAKTVAGEVVIVRDGFLYTIPDGVGNIVTGNVYQSFMSFVQRPKDLRIVQCGRFWEVVETGSIQLEPFTPAPLVGYSEVPAP